MTQKELYLGVGALVVIALSFYLLYAESGLEAIRGSDHQEQEVPAMTALMKEVLEKSTGFQLLVSYTDRGFEPAHASIKVGDAVRFTNNSSRELWVSSAAVHSANIYPGGADSCGQSSFDSCVTLQPKEFWEFTFEESGRWGYINVAETSHSAALEVI